MADIEKKPVDDGSLNRSLELKHEERADLLPDPDAGLSDEERAANDKRLVRRLDIKLIPWLCLLYLASFLDRTNIGNAS